MMEKVQVITDSTADIDQEIASSLHIRIVPIYVRFGDRVYRDGVDITRSEFYQRLTSSPIHPATSQPPPEDFSRYYSDALKSADKIVSIHVSSKISGTYNSALMAKKLIGQNVQIEVVDSQFNSAGLGLIVKAAASLARDGADIYEVLNETNKAIRQVQMFGMFETMKYLALSGRVSNTIATAASFLHVMPLLTFKNGEIVRAGLTRSVSKGMDRIFEFVKARMPLKEIVIVHSDIPDQAQELLTRLSGLIRRDLISITELGTALGVHGGPGVLVIGLRKYI